MKRVLKKIGQNTTILIASFLCALAIFSITKNPNLFLSSVLSTKEQAFITKKNRDIAYKNQSGVLEIFLAPKHTNTFTSIQANIYLSPDKTQIQTNSLSGKGNISFQRVNNDSFKISLQNMTQIQTAHEIISIPFSGDTKSILLGECQGTSGTQRINLSVGSLNEKDSHNKDI